MALYLIRSPKGGLIARIGAKNQAEAEAHYRAGYRTGFVMNGERQMTQRHYPEGCTVERAPAGMTRSKAHSERAVATRLSDERIWATMSTSELEASAVEYEHKIKTGAYKDDGFLADIARRIRIEINRRKAERSAGASRTKGRTADRAARRAGQR